MNPVDDTSFLEAIDYFSEENAQAREILKNAHQTQNAKLPQNYYAPFADLSGLPVKDHALLQKFFASQANQLEKAKENIQDTQSEEIITGSHVSSPPLYVTPMSLSTIKDISRILGRAQPTDESAYGFMTTVLAHYPLFYYAGSFYCRKNCVFCPISEQELRAMIFPIVEPALASGKNARLISNIIDLLRDCPYIKVHQTTETPDRVFFTNGVYDLSSHKLLSPCPKDFVTSYIPFEYIASNTACPEFDRFLLGISGGNSAVISLIWETIGYLISNDMSAKVFFLLQGVGDSGKSVLGNLISSLFNDESLAHLDIYRFKDKFATSTLRGKRLNICMDLPRAQISREAIGVIKMLTGDDTITVEAKFKPSESYKPTCKLLFGSNFPLMPADNDPAFRARLIVIPFLYPVPKERQDKHLLEKLLKEKSAIVTIALDAYLNLRARNYQFVQVNSTMNAFVGYIPSSDLMESFLTECCTFTPDGFTFTIDLQEAYNKFCAIHCAPPIEDLAIFSRKLNQYCLGKITSKRCRKNGRNLNGYEGIRLST